MGFVSGVSDLPGLSPPAELWTRIHDLLKPSPAFYHFILTQFRWFWDIINSTFIRDMLMRLILTGEGLERVSGCSRTWDPPRHQQRWGWRSCSDAEQLPWAWWEPGLSHLTGRPREVIIPSCHPIMASHHPARGRLPSQAAAGRRGSAGRAAHASPAVRPQPRVPGRMPGCQPAGRHKRLSARHAPRAKRLLSSRTESSLWKYGAGPCYSCPYIHRFA